MFLKQLFPREVPVVADTRRANVLSGDTEGLAQFLPKLIELGIFVYDDFFGVTEFPGARCPHLTDEHEVIFFQRVSFGCSL